MTLSVDQFIAEFARLKERVQTLEVAAYGAETEYIEGWTAAGRFLGINERTCKRRLEAGLFPVPCGYVTVSREVGPDHERPRWRRKDLVAYAEDKATDGK